MMHSRHLVLALALLIATLLACKGSGPQDVTATDGTCKLTKPSGWMVTDSLHDDASIQITNPLQGTFFIILTDVKQDLDLKNLQAFSDLVRGSIKTNSSKYQETNRQEHVIGGRPAISYRIAATVDSVKIVYLHTVIEGEKHYLQVLGWTTDSKYSEKEADFEKITASVREL